VGPGGEGADADARAVGAVGRLERRHGAADVVPRPELLLHAGDAVPAAGLELVAGGGAEDAEGEPAREPPRELGRAYDGGEGADAAGVEEASVADADGVVEDAGALEEERAALVEERLERREVELGRVGLDLPEVRVDRGVEDDVG